MAAGQTEAKEALAKILGPGIPDEVVSLRRVLRLTDVVLG